jgi:hypothetical protein
MNETTRKNREDLKSIDTLAKENMFIVRDDGDGVNYYDLTDDVFIDVESLSKTDYYEYKVHFKDTCYSISKNLLDSTSLWWVILVFNDITNPFDIEKMVGQTIKIPSANVVSHILNSIG